MQARMLFCLLLMGCLVGCGGSSTSRGTPDGDAGGGQAELPTQETPDDAAGISIGLGQPPVEDSPSQPDAPTQDPPPADREPDREPDTERVKADVGVGAKGRSLDEHEGVLVTPAKAYFSMREKAIFQIAVPQALQFFEAQHGSGPKTHDQFMTDVIQANGIALPELPPGQRYVYDPEAKELMVERPAR
jgi:hypothetical protein